MDLDLRGRVVVVTGGASNIGRAISMEFAREGSRVAILDRDAAMAQRTTADAIRAGGAATAYEVDLTDTARTEEIVAAVEAELGPVEVLVNNVGWNGPAGFFLELPPERWNEAYRLNLFPTLNATRAVLPAMVERRAGSIVSIASDAGFGEVKVSDYGAMKAGVMAFMRSVAREYGRYGIRANTVCPGVVVPAPGDIGERSLWQQQGVLTNQQIAAIEAGIPLRRRPEARDIAWATVFLSSAPARQLTGQVLSVSGGFNMPR